MRPWGEIHSSILLKCLFPQNSKLDSSNRRTLMGKGVGGNGGMMEEGREGGTEIWVGGIMVLCLCISKSTR